LSVRTATWPVVMNCVGGYNRDMKRIYGISKLQLIVIWFFGIILAVVVQDCGYNTVCGSSENAVTTVVLFALVFYTVGWWQNKKATEGN